VIDMHTIRILTVAGAIVLTGLGLTACGSTSTGTATPSSTTPPAPVAAIAGPTGTAQPSNATPTQAPHGTGSPNPTHVPPPPATPPTTTPPAVPVHVPPSFAWTTFDLACWGVPLNVTFGVDSDGPVSITASVTYWTSGSPLPRVQTSATFPSAQHSSIADGETTTTFFDSLPVNTIHPFEVNGTLTATDADGARTSKTFSEPVSTTCIS
jgi:hypothetical protein